MKQYLQPLTIAIVLLTFTFKSYSQDKHFSQFDAAPLYYNPGQAGVYDGNHRFMGNFKSQWKTYETYMLSYDRMLPKTLSMLGGFFGAGIMVNHDVQGVNSYSTTELNLLPAFHKPIIDNKVMLSSGLGLTTSTFSVDQSTMIPPSSLEDPNYEEGSYDGFESTREFNFDVSLGVNLHYVVLDKHPTNLGITWHHLLGASSGFTPSNDRIDNPRRFSINANSEIEVAKDVKLLPSLIWMYQLPVHQINTGTFVRYDLEKKNKVLKGIYVGGWYRFGDAIITGIAFDFPGFQDTHLFNFGISYDINVSSSYRELSKFDSSYGSNGSFEVSLKYIIKGKPFKFETPGIINEPVM